MVKGPQLATPWNCSFSQSEPQSKGKFLVHSQILSYGRRTTLQKNGLDPRLQPWLRAGSSRYVGEFSHDYTDEKFFPHTVEDSLNSRSQTLSLGNNVSQSNWFIIIIFIFLLFLFYIYMKLAHAQLPIHQYPQFSFSRAVLHLPACTERGGLPRPKCNTLHLDFLNLLAQA